MVSLGAGRDGFLYLFDDAAMSFAPLLRAGANGTVQLQAPDGTLIPGAVRPVVGDADGDNRADVVLGVGAGGGAWLRILRPPPVENSYDSARRGRRLRIGPRKSPAFSPHYETPARCARQLHACPSLPPAGRGRGTCARPQSHHL